MTVGSSLTAISELPVQQGAYNEMYANGTRALSGDCWFQVRTENPLDGADGNFPVTASVGLCRVNTPLVRNNNGVITQSINGWELFNRFGSVGQIYNLTEPKVNGTSQVFFGELYSPATDLYIRIQRVTRVTGTFIQYKRCLFSQGKLALDSDSSVLFEIETDYVGLLYPYIWTKRSTTDYGPASGFPNAVPRVRESLILGGV